MMNAGLIDFMFTGAVFLSAMLMFGGHVGEAMPLLIPIAACLNSMHHHQISPEESPAGVYAVTTDREHQKA